MYDNYFSSKKELSSAALLSISMIIKGVQDYKLALKTKGEGKNRFEDIKGPGR